MKAGYGPRVSEQHELRQRFHQQLEDINASLRRMERYWSDQIRYIY